MLYEEFFKRDLGQELGPVIKRFPSSQRGRAAAPLGPAGDGDPPIAPTTAGVLAVVPFEPWIDECIARERRRWW